MSARSVKPMPLMAGGRSPFDKLRAFGGKAGTENGDTGGGSLRRCDADGSKCRPGGGASRAPGFVVLRTDYARSLSDSESRAES
ncbi:hypothetical protein GALL_330840 [mine drainage metagenome]|uniref:Uncharacterized protein n=1 Tax=mine drainage metagenome TaxID=410659 RepID=A0A1J5QNX2_9ZZZZ